MMAARYRVLVSDILMASEPEWPAGLRPVGDGAPEPGGDGTHWLTFDDEDAPADLEGKRVVLDLEVIAGVPGSARIAGRRVIA